MGDVSLTAVQPVDFFPKDVYIVIQFTVFHMSVPWSLADINMMVKKRPDNELVSTMKYYASSVSPEL